MTIDHTRPTSSARRRGRPDRRGVVSGGLSPIAAVDEDGLANAVI